MLFSPDIKVNKLLSEQLFRKSLAIVSPEHVMVTDHPVDICREDSGCQRQGGAVSLADETVAE